MRPPDGHHQQASLFLCELVYLASPTTIRKRANRTQAYIFHLWHASLGLCKTRQQTKAWMAASTSNRAINLAWRQSHNTMSSLICYTEKNNNKKKSQNTPPCVKQCGTRLRAMAGRYTTGGSGASIPGHLETHVFLGNSLLFKGIYSCNKAVLARGLGLRYLLWSHTSTFHRKL